MDSQLASELERFQSVYDLIVTFLVNYSFQLLGAIVVFIIGWQIAKRISKFTQQLCLSKNIDVTLSQFIANVIKITILVMIAIVCLNMIGISITPFIAAIGALSLGAGLAVQGLVSNFGAGFNIILTRPFVIGDTISVQGVSGLVKEVHLAFTVLKNEDGVEIQVPNKHIVGEVLHNSGPVSLVELSVGVDYKTDVEQLNKIIGKLLSESSYVEQNPKFQFGISEFADSGIVVEIRFWSKTTTMIAAKYSVNQSLFEQLNQHKINIPYPRREIEILNENIDDLTP